MSKYKVFIDQGQIKIIQFNGLEYALAIEKQKKKVDFTKKTVKVATLALVFFVLLSLSPLFSNIISGLQIMFFIFCSVVSAFIISVFAYDIDSVEKDYNHLVQEYNLAKEELQPEIMSLQKQLIKHNSEIQQLETQAKFSFKKSATQEITF